MMLGKATVEKIEAIEDDDVRVEAVGNFTKLRMAAMLAMCRNTVRVQTDNKSLRLYCIVELNALGFLKNGVVVRV